MTKSVSTLLLRIAFIAIATFSLFSGIAAYAATATVSPGKKVTLSVAANGTAPFNYQWKKDGVDITGATSSTYVMTGVQSQNTGSYTVRVYNAAGSTISDVGSLTVIAVIGDFNGDNQPDILWQNAVTGQRALWLMNKGGGFPPASIVNLGNVDTNWQIAGVGDFNKDNNTDILWQNMATGQRALWLMNGIGGGFSPASIIDLGYVDTNWKIAGIGDFNNDNQLDILWQNLATGQRALWLMNGIGGGFTPASIVNLGNVDTNWQIAGVADFNNDNQLDILWQNTATGQRALWLMNGIGGGLTPTSIINLGFVDANWLIAGVADFNGDGQVDILWQNTATGQRALWLMNGIGGGLTPASIVNLGYVDTNWVIAN